jgi:hypothetical protein
MLKAQNDARQLLHSNPLVASFVGQLLKHTTAPLQVEWGKIKGGLTYELSPALPVTGRQLKDTIIADGIRTRYAEHPYEGKHSDGSAWHVVYQGVTFVVHISRGTANKFLPAANKRQKTSQSRASEHLEKEVGLNAVLTTAAESVKMCNQVLLAGIEAKSTEAKALQEELADRQKDVEALKPKIYGAEQMIEQMHGAMP